HARRLGSRRNLPPQSLEPVLNGRSLLERLIGVLDERLRTAIAEYPDGVGHLARCELLQQDVDAKPLRIHRVPPCWPGLAGWLGLACGPGKVGGGFAADPPPRQGMPPASCSGKLSSSDE